MVNEKRWHKGEYSGNVRLNPKTFEEKELDDPYTKKLWLEDLPSDPDFLDDMKDMVKNRMENFTPYMDLNDVKVHFAGESHLDMAYKWRIEQTHKKAVKTLKKAVQHCEYFPDQNDFKFLFSSPQILEWIEEHDPILLRKIKKWVKKDKIEPVGGSWVETDCMLPSGESFVRSRFYGMKKFRDLFGKDFMPQYEWFPDSFGYNVGLPQILAKSGAMGMKTQKMTWCKQNIFPFIHFWWKSPDGSKI